jgi:predicted secreted Zn-dependent protease
MRRNTVFTGFECFARPGRYATIRRATMAQAKFHGKAVLTCSAFAPALVFEPCRKGQQMQLMRGLAVLTASAASLLLADNAGADPTFSTKYSYYKISGESAAEVYLSMLRRGPHVQGEKAYAATSAESSQRGRLEIAAKSCRIADYQYSVEFTIRLPRLADESALPGNARGRWRQFSNFLRTHEETHRSIWMGCANEIETKIKNLRGRTCEEVDARAQHIRDAVQAACNRKHVAFDSAEQIRLTKHPFVKMVLGPLYSATKPASRTTTLVAKKRKKSTVTLTNW